MKIDINLDTLNLAMTYSSLSSDELVRACAESENAEAWQEFVRRFEKLIGLVVLRVARRYGETSSTVIEDLIQETYLKLCADDCKLLRNFEARHEGAFFGMLKVTAVSVALDFFRQRYSIKRGSGKVDAELNDAVSSASRPVSPAQEKMEREILLQEIDTALQTSSSSGRDREIFWLHYRQGFTADAIAEMSVYGLTVKGVESILQRLRVQVRARLVDMGTSINKNRPGAEGIRPEKTLLKGEGQS